MKSILFIFGFFVSILSAQAFVLDTVTVACEGGEVCTPRSRRFEALAGEYRSIVHLKNTLKVMASDGGYQSFSYVLEEKAGVHELKLKLRMKPVVQTLEVVFDGPELDIPLAQLLSIAEGEFYEPRKVLESGLLIQRRLEGLGYPGGSHVHEVKISDGGAALRFIIRPGVPRLFQGVKTNATSSYVDEFIKRKFGPLFRQPFEYSKFKLTLDEAQRDLFSYGYYLIGLDMVPVVTGNLVELEVRVNSDQLFTFDFQGAARESREELLTVIKELFRRYKRPLTKNVITQALKEHYEKLALLDNAVTITTSKHRNKFQELVNHYRIDVREGEKTRMWALTFTGNSFFTDSQLQRLFRKEAFELAAMKYLDQEFLAYFVDFLKTEYIKNGFVQVKVQGPVLNFSPDRSAVEVELHIQEGPRAFVKDLRIAGAPPTLKKEILSGLSNQEERPFDPIGLMEDLKRVAIILQEKGYYFAEVLNHLEDDVVKYNRVGTEVEIHIVVDPGPQIRLNRVLILGNQKTQRKVIEKKVYLEPGELITPAKTKEIESSLSATGLFTTVNVTPLKHTSKAAASDLVIKVTERDYGLIEFAPGYRTDLGIKLTGTASYLNIGGRNQALTLKGQVNQRLNHQTLAPERRNEKLDFIEYNAAVTFNQGDIFDSLIDYSAAVSNQRRRFYPFDANIARINNTFTRDLNKQLSASIRYQYETITQFNAVEERDDGSFRIGAVTPVLTWDLRNSQILPTAGAFFNLSCEIANPFLLSQKEADLTINFYKLVSRNRFYYPIPNGTIALSAVLGVQENLETDLVTAPDGDRQTAGYIPNIKVFRLTGMDIVRGYSDEEINRQPNGDDISQFRVEDKAFIANFKLEPRYFINDNFMTGLFLDAGRVFIDQFNPSELRTSVGLTFKILTPVGTLDFDYGIKLLRKRDAGGRLEDPGRFHVSIGFF